MEFAVHSVKTRGQKLTSWLMREFLWNETWYRQTKNLSFTKDPYIPKIGELSPTINGYQCMARGGKLPREAVYLVFVLKHVICRSNSKILALPPWLPPHWQGTILPETQFHTRIRAKRWQLRSIATWRPHSVAPVVLSYAILVRFTGIMACCDWPLSLYISFYSHVLR